MSSEPRSAEPVDAARTGTAPPSALTGTWRIDPERTRIGFSSRHAMVTTLRGAFHDAAGRIVLDEEDIERSHVEVTVQMASIDTGSPSRDEHLRGPGFFDVGNHPEMTFRSHRVETIGEGGRIVAGDLTIRGRTSEIDIPLHLVDVGVDASGRQRAAFEGARRIDRRRWGVSWNAPLDSGGLLVGDRITLEFAMSLIKESDEVAPVG